MVDKVLANPTGTRLAVWMVRGNPVYTSDSILIFRILDMAVGLGKMLGFELTENFNYPYLARTCGRVLAQMAYFSFRLV